MISNSTAIAEVFSRIDHKFDLMCFGLWETLAAPMKSLTYRFERDLNHIIHRCRRTAN